MACSLESMCSTGTALIMLTTGLLKFSSQQPVSKVDRLTDGNTREYCLTEVFEPTCHKNELIVMTSATYGRMRMGRCLEDERSDMLATDDSRFLGCQVDVLPLLDRKCSGKNQCSIRVPDADLLREKPCHSALKAYLEADYECIGVIEEDRSCVVQVSSNPLHIIRSSSNSSKLSCGTKSQPWRLEAPVGQQINVSLLEFGASNHDSSSTHNQKDIRQVYGYIAEKSGKRNTSIYRQNQRMRTVYKSSSNEIDIVMNHEQHRSNQEPSPVIIGFIAVGCSDIVPPDDSWLRRNDNEAVIGCYSSRQTWYLRCTGSNWIGVIGNCTREEVAMPVVLPVSSTSIPDYQTLILVAIVCFGVGICLIVICVGVICLRRYNFKNDEKKLHVQEGVGFTSSST